MPSDTKRPIINLSPEIIRKVAEFANSLAWKNPDLDILRAEFSGQYSPLAETLQLHVKRSHARGRLVLPDLRAFSNETVAVFTDYGGESRSAKHFTYSTLVCGWNLKDVFLENMKSVRRKHGLADKEIAFKDFGMGQLQRSLPDYLNALNLLPGFLFTLIVDKRVSSLFGPTRDRKSTREFITQTLETAGFGKRKPEVNEKLLRVIHIAAFLTGLLAHDGHKIFWMTDHDAIAATNEMHEKTLALFQRVLGLYARKGYAFPLIGGALPFPERSVEMLDLLSVTDVVAGALEHYLLQKDLTGSDGGVQLKPGCERVLRWLAQDGIGLKKMNVIMRLRDHDTLDCATVEFALEHPSQDAIVIPIVV
jgi:hypothetical protein